MPSPSASRGDPSKFVIELPAGHLLGSNPLSSKNLFVYFTKPAPPAAAIAASTALAAASATLNAGVKTSSVWVFKTAAAVVSSPTTPINSLSSGVSS